MYLVEGDLVVKKEGLNGENNDEIGEICVVEEVKRIKNSSDQYIIRSLATGITSGWWVDSQLEFCCAGNDKIIEKARELLNKNKITLDKEGVKGMKKICCPNCGVDYSYTIDKIDIDISMDNKNLISGITDLECPFCGYRFKLKLNSMDIINFFVEQAYNNKTNKDNSEKVNKTNIKNDMENKINDVFEFIVDSKTKNSESLGKLEKLLGGYDLKDYKINLNAEDNKDNNSTTNNLKTIDDAIKIINDKLNNKDCISNIYETFSKLSEIINTENDMKNSGAGTVTKEDNSSKEDSNGSNEDEDRAIETAETTENSDYSNYIAPDGTNYEVYYLAQVEPFGDFYTQKDLGYILDIIEEILYNLSDLCEETDGCENCVFNGKCPYAIEEWLDITTRGERIKALEILLNNKKEISYIEDFRSRFIEYDVDPLKSAICREAIYKTDGRCPKGVTSCKECWEQKYLI